MTESGEGLEYHAQRYLQSPRSPNLQSNFLLRLQLTSDEDLLLRLYAENATRPELTVPVCRRLTEIKPDNIDYLVSLGFTLYSIGVDDEATECVDKALKLNPNSISALELQAAIAPTIQEKRAAFAKIINLDPGNKEAFQQLVMLRTLEEG